MSCQKIVLESRETYVLATCSFQDSSKKAIYLTHFLGSIPTVLPEFLYDSDSSVQELKLADNFFSILESPGENSNLLIYRVDLSKKGWISLIRKLEKNDFNLNFFKFVGAASIPYIHYSSKSDKFYFLLLHESQSLFFCDIVLTPYVNIFEMEEINFIKELKLDSATNFHQIQTLSSIFKITENTIHLSILLLTSLSNKNKAFITSFDVTGLEESPTIGSISLVSTLSDYGFYQISSFLDFSYSQDKGGFCLALMELPKYYFDPILYPPLLFGLYRIPSLPSENPPLAQNILFLLCGADAKNSSFSKIMNKKGSQEYDILFIPSQKKNFEA